MDRKNKILFFLPHLIFFLICFIEHASVTAQGISLQWAKSMGGSLSDQPDGLAIDQNGNVYTTGSFTGTSDFDPGPSIASFTSNGSGDIFVNKLDANGNFVWTRQMGGIGNDVANAITIDASGNVYTTGTFSATVDFDPGPGVLTFTSAGGYDFFIQKLDPSGNLVWAKQFGSIGNDDAASIVLDPSGNVYTTGSFSATVDFDPGPATYTLNSGGRDFYVCKLDANGNFMMAMNMSGTPSNVIPESIQLDGAGNIYLSGMFWYTNDFMPGPGTYTLTTSGALLDYDIFIAKYDPSANFIYAKSFGNNQDYDDARDMIVDIAGNVYTTGYVQNVVDFDPGPGIYTLTVYGQQDIFVHKLDPAGNFVWARRMGFAGADYGNGICLDAAGNIYTSGGFYSTVDFDPGPGTYTLGAGAAENVFIQKLDPSGNFIFAKQLTGNGNDAGRSLTMDASGNLFLTGAYTSTIDLDPGPANQISNSAGSWDVFVEKYNSCLFSVAGAIDGTATVCSGATAIYSISPVAGALGYAWTLPTGWSGSSSTNSISVVAGNSGGTIAVSVMDACGTGPSSTLSLVVNPSPTISVNSGSICSGQSFTMVPSGASSYTFQGGSAVLSPTVNSSFTIAGTNSLGCVSNTNAICSITVQPLPNVSVNSGSICSGTSFTMIPSGANNYTFSGGSAIVSPTISSSYSVTGTSTAGCISGSAAICNVTVNPSPTITVNSGTICSGKSFTLIPSGAVTYSYSGGSPVVTPVASTSYSVFGSNAFGCVSQVPAISSVTVLLNPTITVNSGSICSGGSFTINPGGASTYTFSGGSAIVSPSVNTNYSVTGTNTLGCVSPTPAVSSVTVNPRPLISVNSGSICNGQSFTMVPSGANSYTFSGGFSVVSPSLTTSYSVSGTSAAGCVSALSAFCNVSVCPNPNLVVAGGSICPGYSFTFNPSGGSTYLFSGGSQIVSPPGTTAYTIKGVSVEGCSSEVTVTVVVTNTLTVAIVGNNTVCAGSKLNLEASGALNYSWSTGDTAALISPAITTNTILSVIGANGTCSNSAQISVNVSALPSLSITGNNAALCNGSFCTLSVSGAKTYVWSTGVNGPSVAVGPPVTSTYSVSGTDDKGCNTVAEVTAEVVDCNFTLFPNPTYNKVIVSGGKVMSENIMEVYNPLGQIIVKLAFTNKAEIDLADKAAGVYLVKIISEDKSVVLKVVRE